MNITCVICSDLFTPSASIYTTSCGHIFHYNCLLHWFENSKTCPQCRTKASPKSLVRLYINVSASQGPEADVTVLQYKLDAAEFSMKLKERDVKEVAQKNQELTEQNKKLRATIKELELSTRSYESVIAALKDQIKYFKAESLKCTQLQNEVRLYKCRIKDLEHVQLAVEGSRQQVEDMIKNENNVESLALLAATLKKSLVDTNLKKKEVQYELKKTQNELSQCKRKMTEKECEYANTKKELESLKLNYEREVSFLKNKFTQLKHKEIKGSVNDSLSQSIIRITSESPINYNRRPVLSGKQDDVIDLETLACSGTLQPKVSVKDDSIIDLVKDSPLAPSSMGMFAMQREKLGNKLVDNKFSIFKNKHSTSLSTSTKEPSVVTHKNYKRVDFSYDGLGGSAKQDIYPTSGKKRTKTSKSTSKFKKLSADAGKPNRKLSEFLNSS